jgi:hypothetical protein
LRARQAEKRQHGLRDAAQRRARNVRAAGARKVAEAQSKQRGR